MPCTFIISPGWALFIRLPLNCRWVDFGIAPRWSCSGVYWIFNYWKDLNLEWLGRNVNFPDILAYLHLVDLHSAIGVKFWSKI
jgi:hypothetical protein